MRGHSQDLCHIQDRSCHIGVVKDQYLNKIDMKYAMQLKVMLALGLLGFANMILAEIITMASPDLIHQILLDIGIWVPSILSFGALVFAGSSSDE